MSAEYKHVEVSSSQSSKKPGKPSGDVIAVERTVDSTTIILCDGIGSGIKASIAANLSASRLLELIRRNFSLRDAFRHVVQTMHDVRGTDLPYAVLTVARILNNGDTTVLSYEMPPPLLYSDGFASLLKQNTFLLGSEVVAEAEFTLKVGDGIYLMSDGVTQSGMGEGLTFGWTTEGVCEFLRSLPRAVTPGKESCKAVLDEALRLSGRRFHDDTSIVFAQYRPGRILNIFTGPPFNPADDDAVVSGFLASPGLKVICGFTSAKIVARTLGREVSLDQKPMNPIEPPAYNIDGIDLVTEGAVTLNQVSNVLDHDFTQIEGESSVQQLCTVLDAADRVNIWVGTAMNEGHQHIRFKQMGILGRREVVRLLVQKLRKRGKLVVVREY